MCHHLPFARSLAPEIIKRRLVRILLGPARPADETTNTNEARNILFELTMASKLWRAGLVPELVEPDIRCEVDGRAVCVACKRPFAGTGSRQAYTDALAQITTGLTGPPASARRVVALSVTRLLNSGGRIFEFTAQAAREDHLGKLLEHLTEEVSAGYSWAPVSIAGAPSDGERGGAEGQILVPLAPRAGVRSSRWPPRSVPPRRRGPE